MEEYIKNKFDSLQKYQSLKKLTSISEGFSEEILQAKMKMKMYLFIVKNNPSIETINEFDNYINSENDKNIHNLNENDKKYLTEFLKEKKSEVVNDLVQLKLSIVNYEKEMSKRPINERIIRACSHFFSSITGLGLSKTQEAKARFNSVSQSLPEKEYTILFDELKKVGINIPAKKLDKHNFKKAENLEEHIPVKKTDVEKQVIDLRKDIKKYLEEQKVHEVPQKDVQEVSLIEETEKPAKTLEQITSKVKEALSNTNKKELIDNLVELNEHIVKSENEINALQNAKEQFNLGENSLGDELKGELHLKIHSNQLIQITLTVRGLIGKSNKSELIAKMLELKEYVDLSKNEMKKYKSADKRVIESLTNSVKNANNEFENGEKSLSKKQKQRLNMLLNL